MLIDYIDNEVPAFAEWDIVVQAGASTIVQTTSASFPDRGSIGLRHTQVLGSFAYVEKNTGHIIPPGDSFFLGLWLKHESLSASFTPILRIESALNIAVLFQLADGTMQAHVRDDATVRVFMNLPNKEAGQWVYVVFEIQRAATNVSSDGEARLYLNGVKLDEETGIDNFDLCSTEISIVIGTTSSAATGTVTDSDEIKIATTYPEPFVPTPTIDYICPRRICIVYDGDSLSARQLTYIARDQIAIPYANLIPYTGVTSGDVTSAIDDVFANHPTVASNCMCFLQTGDFHIEPSELMNYSGDPAPLFPNPHYQTKTRLTHTDLAGKFMAVVLPLEHGGQMLDGADTMAALSELPDADTLFSEETAYLFSLPAQKLRIVTSTSATFTDDAFVFGDIGVVGNLDFGAAGSRIAWIDPSGKSAEFLDFDPGNQEQTLNAAFIEGYIAGLGYSSTDHGFDAETFFEVLRIGTFAEAAFASVPFFNSGAVPAGSPLLTAPFQTSGYNVYRGKGPLVDWSRRVAYLRHDVGAVDNKRTATLVTTHDNSTQYTYGIRAVRLNVETPGYDQLVDFTLDSVGTWVGNRPVKVVGASAKTKSGGNIRVTWRYEKGTVVPDDFSLWFDTVEPDGTGAPDATVNHSGVHYNHTFTLSDGQTYFFRIVAVASGVESEPVIIGPFLADATAPDEPTLTTSTSF